MTNYSRHRIINALMESARQADEEGRYEESDFLLRQATAIAKQDSDSYDSAYIPVLTQLADSYTARSMLEEAEILYREVIALLETKFGKKHLSVGIACRNLSEILKQQGKKPKADELLERCWSILNQKLRQEIEQQKLGFEPN